MSAAKWELDNLVVYNQMVYNWMELWIDYAFKDLESKLGLLDCTLWCDGHDVEALVNV